MNFYLKTRPCLGNFSEVSLGSLRVLSEAHLDWLWKLLPDEKAALTKNTPSINDIFLVCAKITAANQRVWSRSSPLNMSEAVGYLRMQKEIWHLDELANRIPAHAIVLPVIAQLLFERFTSFTSRLVVVDSECGTRVLAIAIKLVEHEDPLFFAVTNGQLTALSGRGIKEVPDYMQIRNIEREDAPIKTGQQLHILGYNGKLIPFVLTGRSPADRHYAADEKRYLQAGPEDLVPVEIYFHPFYAAFGHTTIRIGKTMYELSSAGWRAHGAPVSSARAFLFNNPFFRTQLERFRWMAPFSLGKVILLPKHKVAQIHQDLQSLCERKGFWRPRFNLFINNCNQGIMAVLESCGLRSFKSSGYTGFSSVLSFRNFLFEHEFETESHRLYIVGGTKGNLSSLRSLFPQQICRDTPLVAEICRGWPVYLADVLTAPARQIALKLQTLVQPAPAPLVEERQIHG